MKKSFSFSQGKNRKKRSMAKRLQKKLEEIEYDLSELIHHPMETKVAFLFEAIQRRFIFLKNLLSAEMETHSNDPQYLHDISLRMALLERAFLDWVELTKTPDQDFDTHSTPNPDIDIPSLCSCPKSPISEDEEPSFPVEEAQDEEANVDQVEQDILPVIAVVEEGRGGQKKKVVFGKKGRIVAVVVAAWAAWIATASFSVPGYYEEREFLTPT